MCPRLVWTCVVEEDSCLHLQCTISPCWCGAGDGNLELVHAKHTVNQAMYVPAFHLWVLHQLEQAHTVVFLHASKLLPRIITPKVVPEFALRLSSVCISCPSLRRMGLLYLRNCCVHLLFISCTSLNSLLCIRPVYTMSFLAMSPTF